MKTWTAKLKIGGKGAYVDAQTQAKTRSDAEKLFKGQYAAGTTIHFLKEVR